MNSELSSFFSALSERMGNENNLSDITYALCQANEDFKNFFVSFCFDEELKAYDLEREYSNGNSRLDFFFIDQNQTERVIEVKIWDRNQHFAQYPKDFPEAKYAFIANYGLDSKEKNEAEKKGWKIKQWKGFLNKLKESTISKSEIVDVYSKCIGKILEIKEFEKMNLEKISSLPVFYENLTKIFMQDYGFYEYNRTKSMDGYWYGRWFYRNDLYFWVGITFPEGEICIEFYDDKSWTPQKILKNIKASSEKGNFYEKGDVAYFKLKEKNRKILCDDSKSKEEQEKVLKDFFEEVMSTIGVEEYL